MDGDSAIPPYAWIAWQLRDAIRAGTPGLGEPVPSESELAVLYGVSHMTAGKVLGLLVGCGPGPAASAAAPRIGKPFTALDLLQKVRTVLAGYAGGVTRAEGGLTESPPVQSVVTLVP